MRCHSRLLCLGKDGGRQSRKGETYRSQLQFALNSVHGGNPLEQAFLLKQRLSARLVNGAAARRMLRVARAAKGAEEKPKLPPVWGVFCAV
jgi:hypothetical protein